MKETTFRAIVLKVADHKESDRRLTLLTPEGKTSAVLRGVKKRDAKLKPFSQPFCFAEFTVAEGKGIPIVTGAEMEDAFYGIVYDPDKFFRANVMLEATDCSTEYDAPCPEVFVCLAYALRTLAYTESSPQAVLSKFILELSRATGYAQRYDACAVCGNAPSAGDEGFSLRHGGLVCRSCADARPLTAHTHGVLATLDAAEWDDLVGIDADGIDLGLCAEYEKLIGVRLGSLACLKGA